MADQIVGHTLPAGAQVELSFAGGEFTADGGSCNDVDGGYRVRNGRLETLQVTQSLVGCGDEPTLNWIAHFLPGAEVTLSGDRLTLHARNTLVRFVPRLARDSPTAVVGQLWVLAELTERGRQVGLVHRQPSVSGPSLRLEDRIGWFTTPCARVDMTVRPSGKRWTLSPVSATAARRLPGDHKCTGPKGKTDAAMRRALNGDVTAARNGKTLTVANATTTLRFRLHRVGPQ